MTARSLQPRTVAAGAGIGLIVLSLAVFILHTAAAIMIPFVIAVFVWHLINAAARGLMTLSVSGLRLPRFLCFLLAILALAGGLWLALVIVSANAADVVRAAPLYQKKFADFLPVLLGMLPDFYQPKAEDVMQVLDIGGFITALVRTFTGVAGKALVVLFYTGFLLYEQRFFARKLAQLAGSSRNETRVQAVLHNIDFRIQRYVWVRALASALKGLLTWLLLTLAGVDFAGFWGVMAFLLSFIPYAGPLAAVVLPAVAALVQFGTLAGSAWILGGLSAAHAFGLLLDRRLLDGVLNLSPIFVISSLAMWGMIWGVPGMFLSVPILAVVVITLAQFPETRAIAVLLSRTGEIEGVRRG